jgi:peptidoglycan/xylan/chitin deacetylase (PgdA/CDA1 family)
MRLLKARYRVVDLRAVTMGIGLDADTLNVAITFDDGFPEQLDAAAAVLREEEVPAAFFVITGALDLAPPQAEEFYRSRVRAASGESATSQAVAAIGGDPLFEIGSHSATHADLGALGDGAGLRDELGGSRASLERIVGRSVESFAYPFGAQANLSPQAEAAAREAGYTSAWTTLPGFNSRATDRFRLHRDNLEPSMDDGLFVAWIEGGYDLVRWGADLLRGRG